ncbi:MAG: hypothetical protein INR68_03280 [Methylobacterium mesophilicum]|nr:hypothetical protein [Methylobacterium mesophilicum]
MPARFTLVLDPVDQWSVWDNETGEPTFFGDMLLAGMSKVEAEAACEILNRIYENRMREAERLRKRRSDGS